MTAPLRYTRLALSPWPFLLLAPPEFFGIATLITGGQNANDVAQGLIASTIAVGISLLLLAITFPLVTFARRRPWGDLLRTTTGVVLVYVVLGTLQALLILTLTASLGGHGGPSPLLTTIYILTRPINLIILAIVVGQLGEGIATMRTVNGEVAERLELARRTNAMLEQAEAAMREDSRATLVRQVRGPLRRLARNAHERTDTEVADDLDAFIATRLRPLSHVLHPVSVRLGLVSAVKSLDAEVYADAAPAIERMDRDGVLLDEGVRLQVYRWIRDRISPEASTRVAIVVRGRELEVSVHPSTAGSLDAVQVVAGLREIGRGVLRAPLRGQVPSARQIARHQGEGEAPGRVRQRVRDVLTTPLPRRVGLVALIGLALVPNQLILYQFDVDWRSILLGLTTASTAIALAAIFSVLPQPRQSVSGAVLVVVEWVATGIFPALAFSAAAFALGLYSTFAQNIAFDLFRGTYRFTIFGLILVVANGVVVQAHRALAIATAELEMEERRRERILAQSRQLDADVAEALHRTVQGRLAAAVVLIRLGRRAEAWEIVEGMAGVEIPRLLDRMQAPSGVVPVVPSGMRVEVFGAEALPEPLIADVRTALGEIAVNAQRHGGASSLQVRIVSVAGVWTIECRDDGTGFSEQPAPGLGSRLLEELTARYGGHWSLESGESGCLVLLEIPDPVRNPTSASVSV
ncbi:MAG: hypothetical protein VW082_06245 [Candidatus Nanopelagicales bacterium]|jgi:hypothetical protein